MNMSLRQIGVIHTPYKKHSDAPAQGRWRPESEGTVELDPSFADALTDLDRFSHIWLLYWFDRADGYSPLVVPYMDTVKRGLFATRYYNRPNPIGITLVELVSINGTTIEIKGVDMLDGTPLLDIKPYAPVLDGVENAKNGWLPASGASQKNTRDKEQNR